MTTDRRKLVLAVVFLGVCSGARIDARARLEHGLGGKSRASKKNASAIGRIRESSREAQIADGTTVEPDSAAAEDLAARAYPSNEVTFSERQAAIAAGAKVAKRKAKHQNAWESLGPSTLNVDRLGTQTYQREPSGPAARRRWPSTRSATPRSARCTSAPPAAASGARRTHSRRSRSGTFISGESRRTRSARSPSTRPTRPATRSTSAPARRTAAATARPASASTAAPTAATAGRSSSERSFAPLPQPLDQRRRDRPDEPEPHPDRHALRRARIASNGGRVTAPGPADGHLPVHRRRGDFTLTRAGSCIRGQVRPEPPGVVYAASGGGRPDPLDDRRHGAGRRSSRATAAATRSRPSASETATHASTSPMRTAAAARAVLRPTAPTMPASPRRR